MKPIIPILLSCGVVVVVGAADEPLVWPVSRPYTPTFNLTTNEIVLGENLYMIKNPTHIVLTTACPVSNISVSVSWRTNVVEGSNEQGCRICESLRQNPTILLHHPYHQGGLPYAAPTERWTITTISEVHTLTFDWFGRRTVEYVVPVQSETNRFVLKSTWEEQP